MFPGTPLIQWRGLAWRGPAFDVCGPVAELVLSSGCQWLLPALEKAAGVVHEYVVDVLVCRAEFLQARDDSAGYEQVAVGVVLVTLFLHLLAGYAESYGPVVSEHYAAAPACLYELPGGLGAALPVGGEFGLPPRIPVQTYPDAFLQEADEVFSVGGVVGVADVNAVEINALVLEDRDLLFTDALRRPGVSRNRYVRGLSERGRRRAG